MLGSEGMSYLLLSPASSINRQSLGLKDEILNHHPFAMQSIATFSLKHYTAFLFDRFMVHRFRVGILFIAELLQFR